MIHIAPEPMRPLAMREECDVLRVAVRTKPDARDLRLRLAGLLNQIDAFDECIGLLMGLTQQGSDYEAAMLTAAALFARDAPGDTAAAEVLCRQAALIAGSDRERAAALADEAKAHLRAGRLSRSRDLLRDALKLDPHLAIALKRYAVPYLTADDPAPVMEMIDALLARGVGHCRLLALRAATLARLGRIDEAREALGLACIQTFTVAPPAGWSDLATFNAAVVDELMSNPSMRYGRHGTASTQSWRVDQPATGLTPAISALLAHISKIAAAYAATLDGTCDWQSRRPSKATLHSWAVITEADGHENLHLHSRGWMSGGYYPLAPIEVVAGQGKAGCFAFAAPEALFGDAAAEAIGEILVRPAPGLLTLFPSQAYHKTYPHGAAGRRICIAFDIAPC